MLTPPSDGEDRVQALLKAAMAAFPGDPVAACRWLRTANPLLLGATPAAAAWHSERLAHLAHTALPRDDVSWSGPTAVRQGQVREPHGEVATTHGGAHE